MKLIVVTPAGREKYLRLLSHHVLKSPEVDEWHLWDNCRNEADRAYLQKLAASDPRCKIKTLPSADGSLEIIGRFFRFCDDADALYLRLDDDVVFLEEGFLPRFKERAMAEKGSALWYAPLIINNAVCSTLIKNFSRVLIDGPLTCQAMCPYSWAHASFPMALHPVFIEAVRTNRLSDFRVPDREVRLGRFSINAIGFFGSEVLDIGEVFFPPGNDEEEWLSVTLPAKLDRPGKVFGDLVAAHFSFFTQEQRLLQTTILDDYYALAGLPAPAYEKPVVKARLKDRLRPWRKRKDPAPKYRVSLPADRHGA
ncbi:hypothetical protein FJ970_21000 [Mesorhizobium sp. B2-1-8]|uniref:hypothetical protein n=1 Tax=Mesorhizobium sp. B2-1-8 TaxID=2589967 RepID=UPI00112C36AD|nr:hypothetical protein [Mesorhizobium sp. B2-1-8]UCI17577.1 hypothetical protein FJ970_21000 [Mesorhizobium sp. B2-1-8]